MGCVSESVDVLLFFGVEDCDIWYYFVIVLMFDWEWVEWVIVVFGDVLVFMLVFEVMVDICCMLFELLFKVFDVDGVVWCV